MKKEELTDILRAAATAAGYVFHTGAAHRMNGSVRVYPAAWLEPPALSSAEGRTEGDVTYRVTLHMMALPASADREALWDELVEDALALARAAAADRAVCKVSKISCTPSEQSLTAHGEVSVTLVCDITMWYYL